MEAEGIKGAVGLVIFWADESQYFVEASGVELLTTSRHQRCITVYLAQNLSNHQAVLGSEAKVSAILGSLNLRIFHQNNDPKTSDFASRMIGKVVVKSQSTSRRRSSNQSQSRV